MFTVVDPTTMRLEARCPRISWPRSRSARRCRSASAAIPIARSPARSRASIPIADPTTGQVRVVVSVPNAGKNLVGGLFAEGRVASERRNALVVPTTAVDVTGVKPFVIRLKDGKVERVDVELGLRDEESERVEIKSGLAPGDTLLTGAARGISPGTPVRVNSPSDTPATKS